MLGEAVRDPGRISGDFGLDASEGLSGEKTAAELALDLVESLGTVDFVR